MEIGIGILLLITYMGMIVLSIRGKNLTTVFFLTTILWSIFAIAGHSLTLQSFLSDIIAGSAKNYGANIISIFFGGLFGRVLVSTGIADGIIRRTAELGGDKAWVTLVLLSIVTSLICSSVSGLGIVMAIGVIVIPILLSLGIDKKVAVASFILSIGSGAFFNPALTQYLCVLFGDFDITSPAYKQFAFLAYGVNLTVTLIMSLVLLKRSKRVHAWAVEKRKPDRKDIPFYAMAIPLIPLILCFGFNFDIIPAMLIALFAAFAVTGYFKNPKVMERVFFSSLQESISDSALLVGFLIAVAMFNSVCTICTPYFQAIIGGLIPKSSLILLIAFIVLVPCALYRGPLSVYGSGVAVMAVIISTGYFPDQFIMMLMACTSFGITLCACPTQSWTQWTLNYVKEPSIEHVKTVFPWCWIMVAINMIIAYLIFA